MLELLACVCVSVGKLLETVGHGMEQGVIGWVWEGYRFLLSCHRGLGVLPGKTSETLDVCSCCLISCFIGALPLPTEIIEPPEFTFLTVYCFFLHHVQEIHASTFSDCWNV